MQETPDDKVETNQFSDPHSTVKKWKNLPDNPKTTTLEAKRDSQEPVLDKESTRVASFKDRAKTPNVLGEQGRLVTITDDKIAQETLTKASSRG